MCKCKNSYKTAQAFSDIFLVFMLHNIKKRHGYTGKFSKIPQSVPLPIKKINRQTTFRNVVFMQWGVTLCYSVTPQKHQNKNLTTSLKLA